MRNELASADQPIRNSEHLYGSSRTFVVQNTYCKRPKSKKKTTLLGVNMVFEAVIFVI